MDIQKVIQEYDSMYGKCTSQESEKFLSAKLKEAVLEGDDGAAFTLRNELIGLLRDIDMPDRGVMECDNQIELMEKMGLKGTMNYAICMLNVASLYRAYGFNDNADPIYPEIEDIYKKNLPAGDYNFAALYNNWSILRVNQGRYDEAVELIKKAIAIIDGIPQARIEQATSRVNAANLMMQIYQKKLQAGASAEEAVQGLEDAENFLNGAIDIFDQTDGRDYHKAVALSSKGDVAMLKGEFSTSADYYQQAMELLKVYVGENSAYKMIQARYEKAAQAAKEGK